MLYFLCRVLEVKINIGVELPLFASLTVLPSIHYSFILFSQWGCGHHRLRCSAQTNLSPATDSSSSRRNSQMFPKLNLWYRLLVLGLHQRSPSVGTCLILLYQALTRRHAREIPKPPQHVLLNPDQDLLSITKRKHSNLGQESNFISCTCSYFRSLLTACDWK